MITREQAEQAVMLERGGSDVWSVRECRIESLEQVDMRNEHPVHDCYPDYFDDGWSCTFGYRDKRLPDGEWGPWSSGHCYVVEPKPMTPWLVIK